MLTSYLFQGVAGITQRRRYSSDIQTNTGEQRHGEVGPVARMSRRASFTEARKYFFIT